MARPKKIKAVKVTRTRKVKTKKIKNSFLELNKLYEFYFSTRYENDTVVGMLKGVNSDEFLIERLLGNYQFILKRASVYAIGEYSERSLLQDQEY